MEGGLTMKTQDIRMRKLKFNGHPPPETRMGMGQVGGVLVLIELFALAFTAYTSAPWILRIPIIASIPFGTGRSSHSPPHSRTLSPPTAPSPPPPWLPPFVPGHSRSVTGGVERFPIMDP
ncbi:hypothetical protein FIBSPDRAFT_948858 [Athelia psychrophila]|uniref:Uncharacterized protein n=1 Tax=Athelia psychrophila TaxID=1759441 RepID=A0A166QKA3_9AGAM|nr:hypothetical protein FIBSPDRAFT_948858 [Fibularhizoctonia sp. CBS 109695]